MKVLGEYRAPLETSIAVGVLQQPDPPSRLTFRGVVRHFDHEQPPVGVERDRNRVLHFGLGRRELDAKPFRQPESLQRLAR